MSDASAPWGLVTYRRRGEMADRAGARLGDGTIVQVPELVPYPGLLAALDDWDSVVAALAAPEPPTGEPEPDAVVMTPVRYPRKLLGVGANYASHVEEMHVTPAPPADHPFFFSVPPTTCVIGPDDAVVMPDDPAAKVDWEVELAVVIGRRIRQADATAARAAVAGWTVANDISARGYMWKNDAPPPFNLDWLQHKGRDTFFPIGPVMVPSWALPDPHNLRLRLVRNGTVEQKASTSDMLVDSFELVAAASRQLTLEPGDIIATGTPAGVGMPRNLFLRPGDELVAEIDGIGALRNRVVAESAVATQHSRGGRP